MHDNTNRSKVVYVSYGIDQTSETRKKGGKKPWWLQSKLTLVSGKDKEGGGTGKYKVHKLHTNKKKERREKERKKESEIICNYNYRK